jgi:hypothetical protein
MPVTSYQLPPIDNPKQFEQMLVDLLNEHYNTITFKCFGKNGQSQKGVDVFSSSQKTVVQCKHKDLTRKSVIIKKELLTDIENTLLEMQHKQTVIKFSELIIATTASEHTDYDEYIAELKSTYELSFNICFWGWETIQNHLCSLPITLAKYYPGFTSSKLTNEGKLISNLNVKKKLERDFAPWLNYSDENRKYNSRMIVRSFADTHYPEHPNKTGPWFWFAVEIDRLMAKGLSFITGIRRLYINELNQWQLDEPKDPSAFRSIKVAEISVVAFEDIIEYDLKGDEYYRCPHFFLRFNKEHTPFSEVFYRNLEEDNTQLPYNFDNTMKIN